MNSPDESSPPELAGLNPQDLLRVGLEPPVEPAASPADLDVTVRLSPSQAHSPRGEQPDLPLPEELSALLPGASYHVESFLGQGGMGAVYKGEQIRLKRPVAIKIMQRELGRDHDFEARFEREAQAMAKLSHPNIVSVIDFGEAGPDYLYIVMELVDGADLMDIIRGGQMTQEMALTLLPQICDALQFAHDHGIVHRDIKPSNIMLTRDGRIKMADFGLAKRLDMESTMHTKTGTGMGTPDYAAPEQFDPNAHVDHRADIYALGVMIYQMITGTLPRGAWKSPSERASVAPQWDDIVSRAMQSDPADRYQQASEVKTDVTSISLSPKKGTSTPVRKPPQGAAPQRAARSKGAGGSTHPPVKSRAPLWVGIFGSAAVIGAGAFFALKKPDEVGATAPAISSSSNIPVAVPSVSAATVRPTQTLDLLALVDVQRDRLKAEGRAGKNEWTKRDGQLVFTSGDKRPGKISAPVAINGLRDYEVEVGVPTATVEPIILDLPMSATNQVTIAFVPGVAVVVRDGSISKEFGTWPKTAASPPWKLAVRVKFDADGMNGTLSATINGAPVGTWHGALGKLAKTPEPHPDFPGQLVPALFIPNGNRAHSSWTLRAFAGEAKVLRGGAPSGWQDLLASLTPELVAQTGHGWKLEAGALQCPAARFVAVPLPGSFAGTSYQVRVKLRKLVATQGNFHVIFPVGDRMTGLDLDGKENTYTGLNSADGQGKEVRGTPVGTLIKDTEPHDLELTVRLEGANARISTTLDARPVFDWTGPIPALRQTPVWATTPPGSLALGATFAQWTVSEVKTQRLSASAAGQSPAPATKDASFTNTLGMKFVPVPITGGPTDKQRILFSVWETRVQDFEIFATQIHRARQEADFVQAPAHPSIQVSWEEAGAFCSWLTERERKSGVISIREAYRLPSDHEWSCAAGIGDRENPAELPHEKDEMLKDRPWGAVSTLPQNSGNYWSEELRPLLAAGKYKWVAGEQTGYRDGFAETAPVGSYTANRFGLFDIGGNVWEWCEDWMDEKKVQRVLRGNSWENHGGYLVTSKRISKVPGSRDNKCGFRLVLAPAQK